MSAERSIDFTTFVYWSGAIAERVARALAERARAGVRVRALIDGVGSLPMDEGPKAMLDGSGHFSIDARQTGARALPRTDVNLLYSDHPPTPAVAAASVQRGVSGELRLD